MSGRDLSLKRTFRVGDAMLLVVAAGFGAWLGRHFILARKSLAGGAAEGFDLVGTSCLMLLGVHLGTTILSLLPPRPRLWRLSRQPGFMAGLAVAVWVVLTTASSVQEWASTRAPTSAKAADRAAAVAANNYLLGMASPFSVAKAIILVLTLGVMQGFCWRRDWLESLGRLLAATWVAYWLSLMLYHLCWG